MGKTRRIGLSGIQAGAALPWSERNRGSRNPDGTWVAGVARGPYKPFAIPVGAIFGDLTVVRWDHYTRSDGKLEGYRPVCRCVCGNEGFVAAGNLRAGRSTRCNVCAKRAAAVKRYWVYKHAMDDDTHRTRLLNRLSSAISRCTNPRNASYKHYGERGITVCDDWRNNRASFLEHVQTLVGWDDPALELDRIDNDDGYRPGNIRFATKSANTSNKRKVEDLERRIRELEDENARLRSRKRRAP